MIKNKIRKNIGEGHNQDNRALGIIYKYDDPTKIIMNINHSKDSEDVIFLYNDIIELLEKHGYNVGERKYDKRIKKKDKIELGEFVTGKVNWNCSNCGEPGECLVMQDSRLLCESCYNKGGE